MRDDLETRLRDTLHEAVPDELPASDLANGARLYATRARRARIVTVAGLMTVAFLAAAVLSAEVLRDPKAGPANPGFTPFVCADGVGPTISPPVGGAGLADTTLIRICPDDGSTSSVGGVGDLDGWVLPDDAITLRAAMAEILTPAGGSADFCGTEPLGPAFTVTFQQPDTRLTTVGSADLTCQGSIFLRDFLLALADQDAEEQAASLASGDAACRSRDNRAGALASWSPGDGPVLTSAALCLHPAYFPDLVPLSPTPVQRIELTAAQLAELNADLSESTVGWGPRTACSGETFVYVISGIADDGRRIMLSHACLDVFQVGDSPRVWWTPRPDTLDMIRSLVR